MGMDLVVCEVGSGSGIISANVHNWLRKSGKDPVLHVSIDVNMDASLLSQKYYNAYDLKIEQINASLFNSLNFGRLVSIRPDVILFNPPYVPVEQ